MNRIQEHARSFFLSLSHYVSISHHKKEHEAASRRCVSWAASSAELRGKWTAGNGFQAL
ncbi:hypothetical protein H634G_11516 [Metarhizium anisopliae BRIP 53293]|uniref:Uncharacterized protein n=1 Tax=Metarhizium anisopliae BRIP 53293 TaxID=1291518 RepID=A0A0D9NH45_METAN|nr:hypothetical protein H634G_11516 [Metarhizium anisopliae BRIP 53293]